jgi:hypothetical protein
VSHWQTKMKIRPADKLFSEYIRRRDRKCQFGIRCIPAELTRYDTGELDIRYLDNVHFIGRRAENTRFDEINCRAGCKKCHDYLHKNEVEFDKFMMDLLGEKDFDLLVLRGSTYKKRDDEMDKIACKELLKMVK